MSSEPSILEAKASALAAPRARSGMFALTLYCVAHFFIDLYSSALGAFQPVLVEKLSLTLTEAGFLGAMMTFAGSFTQPLYGILSDRLHSRMFSVLAPAVSGLFISAIGLATNYATALLCVFLGGAGIAAFHPQASARATLGVTANRGRWMAVFISAGTLGLAVGPAYFSTLISLAGVSRTYLGAIPGVLATLLMIACLPEQPAPARRPDGFDLAPLRAVWQPLTILFFCVFLRSAVQITFGQFLTLYLTRERGFPLIDASLTLSAYLACGALGGFVGGHLADKFGGRRVITGSLLGAVPFLALFFWTTGPLSICALVFGGLILLFTIPVNVFMAQELVPAQSGTVSALMMGFAWGMAGLVFIPLTGWIADQHSLQTALSSLIVYPLLGFFLSLKLPK